MKKIITIYTIFSASFLFSYDNPWIYTNYPKPVNEKFYSASIGLGGASQFPYKKHHSTLAYSFKYAMFAKQTNNTYVGYSISGYSQDSDEYFDGYIQGQGWIYYEYSIAQTSYLFAYSYLKSPRNSSKLRGFFYGYDIGLTFNVLGESTIFGLSLSPITAFFDRNERSNIGLGGNIEIGYSLEQMMISLLFGTKWVGSDDFIFFDDIDEGIFEIYHLSLNISYKTF